jgi:mono/diheme cytochrome c family protein
MENRILVGLIMILASMVLIGWVGINEDGRMRAFTEQHLARSIEHGNALFVSSCAECHGPNGLGTIGIAPGLNNPQLFGVNFLGEIDGQIATLESARADIEAIQTTLDGDTAEVNVEALQSRLDGYVETYGEDMFASIDDEIAGLQSQRGAMLVQMAPAIEKGYDPENPNRLSNPDLEWAGTLHSFILTTVTSGRPVSQSYWPRPMPAWSQLAGGPLRSDQVEDLTNFVINYGNKSWTIDDLLAVEQFAIIPGTGGEAGNVAPDVADITLADVEANRGMIDETVDTVMESMVEMIGDPVNGQALYSSLGCAGCHGNAVIAPPTEGTFTRVENTRLQDPALAGYTVEHYLIESILVPRAYIAPGPYSAEAMPTNFGIRLAAQDLVDIVAFLESQDGPDPLAE